MKKHIIIGALFIVLLSSCRNRGTLPTDSVNPSSNGSTPSSVNSDVSSISNQSSVTSANQSTSATQSSSSSSQSSSSSSKPSSSQSSSTSQGGEREGEWFDNHYYYSDLGFYAMGAPKNKDNPITLVTTLSADASSWCNNELVTEDQLGNFRYIYQNSCDDGESGHTTSPDFYSNDAGGMCFDRIATGFGSPMFSHEGAKLEIRLGVSQLTSNTKTVDKKSDTAYIYFFDKDDNYLGKSTIEKESIKNTGSSELKIYYTESNANKVAYFEFRLNSYPYINSKAYNLGISYCNFKSWERA